MGIHASISVVVLLLYTGIAMSIHISSRIHLGNACLLCFCCDSRLFLVLCVWNATYVSLACIAHENDIVIESGNDEQPTCGCLFTSPFVVSSDCSSISHEKNRVNNDQIQIRWAVEQLDENALGDLEWSPHVGCSSWSSSSCFSLSQSHPHISGPHELSKQDLTRHAVKHGSFGCGTYERWLFWACSLNSMARDNPPLTA